MHSYEMGSSDRHSCIRTHIPEKRGEYPCGGEYPSGLKRYILRLNVQSFCIWETVPLHCAWTFLGLVHHSVAMYAG